MKQYYAVEIKCLAQGYNKVPPVRLEPGTSGSQVELSNHWATVLPIRFVYSVFPNIPTDGPEQIVPTQIRLLLKEQSDQGLHYLPSHYNH